MTKTTHIMPDRQRQALLTMDAQDVADFQIRLQVECGMSQNETADYIAQVWEPLSVEAE